MTQDETENKSPREKTHQKPVVQHTTEHHIGFNYVMAAGIITLAPPVALALVFQKWLMKGLTAGAVKG